MMYMYQLQKLAGHKSGVTPANGEIGGQPISVVNPQKVSLMQMDLPDKNPDIPFLGTSSSKRPVARTKTRERFFPVRKPVILARKPVFSLKNQVFPLRKRLFPFRSPSIRPRLVGTFRIKTPGAGWRPTASRFWKRSYGIDKKQAEKKVKYLRQMDRKRSKRKTF